MISPASSAADDEETQIDYEKEMAMASVRGGRGKALPWTSMDTILDYEEVDVFFFSIANYKSSICK